MKEQPFSEQLKLHQLKHLERSIPRERFESNRSWVLKKDHEAENLYKKEAWWQYIKGKEHRWARSLNSSQCFAVNLFAPLADNPLLAHTAVSRLLPHRDIHKDDVVRVEFEHTPEGTREWLGEKGKQPTQVDVFMTISRSDRPLGYFLIEVKLTEDKFGSCRGWSGINKETKKPINPDRDRCRDLAPVRSDVKGQCWMAGPENGRRYWDYIDPPNAFFDLAALPSGTPCPFRHGLYQLMRNQVLASALVHNRHAEWADFGVCLHPDNHDVRRLPEPVAGQTDAVGAFNQVLLSPHKIAEINPHQMVQLTAESESGQALAAWREYMISRYKL